MSSDSDLNIVYVSDSDSKSNSDSEMDREWYDGFRYRGCLGRKYDQLVPQIYSVTFHVTRLGDEKRRIVFPDPVTEAAAVAAAEQFLSKPINERLYEKIRQNTFHRAPWSEAKQWFHCLGDALTDAKFLEVVQVDEEGNATLMCGS